MKRQRFWRTSIVCVTLLFFLVACRKEEVLPTAIPTAMLPSGGEVVSGDPSGDSEGATPTPEITTTPEPEIVEELDPELIDWPPQVIYTSPSAGEEALLDGAITIRFDQPMDQTSVEAAFSIQATDAEGSFVTGSFVWPRADTLIFSPDSSLKRQQTYRVNIGEQASSAKGFQLSEPLDVSLQTVGFLEVSQVIPAEGQGEVEADSAVTVLFNRPVVPLTGTEVQASWPQPLALEPPTTGRGEWVSTSIFRFVPDRPLAGATTYEASVTPDFEDLTGSVLEDTFTWRFATADPGVISIQPENGTTAFDPSHPMTVTFNMPMDRASVEAETSVRSPSAPAARLNYAWSDDDRVLTLLPQQPLSLGASYQIGIAQAAQSQLSGATMTGDVLSGFAVVGFPAVVDTRPGQGQVAERWQRGFSVDFATPMDWSTLEGRIRIEPDPGQEAYFFLDTQLNVDFDLERYSEYVVTIPADAADPYGNTLGREHTWRFFTPESDPIASLNLPQQVSQVSTSFPTDVDIIHRNVSQLDVALYELGLPLNLINEPFSVVDYRPATSALRDWSIPLEMSRERAAVLTLPLADGGTLPTGVYLLSVDAPETTNNAQYWQNHRHALVVADTNIVVKEMFGDVHLWATDLASGRPVSGRNLLVYNSSGAQLGTVTTDAAGLASLDTPADNFLAGITVVSGRPGEAGFGIGRSRWDVGVSPWQFGFTARSDAESPLFAYIYTDRPIYRPGDTVHYKGIVRDADYGRYRLPTVPTVELNISMASFFAEGGLDETISVSLDQTGTFSGDYVLPENLSLGNYQLSLRGQDFSSIRRFSVAEYRRPEFLVTLTPEPLETLRGREAQVVLEARYFFGGPATDLDVTWDAFEESYSPEVPGPFYFFGDGRDSFLNDSPSSGAGSSLGNHVTGGSGVTDEDGRLIITLPGNLLEGVQAGSRTVNIEATISDLADFPVTSRTSVILHAAETYVGVSPSSFIANSGSEVAFDLVTVDWESQAEPNFDVEVVFYRREWRRERDASLDGVITRWLPEDSEVGRDQVVTNGQGRAVTAFVPTAGGTFVAVATVFDEDGYSHTSSTSVWVRDNSYLGWRSDPKERRMDLTLDKQEYQPGETARVMVQSPFEGPVQAWLTLERGELLESQVVTLQGSSDVLEIPIRPQFAPNVFVSVTAVKGITPGASTNLYADIRLGMVEIVVSPEQLALNLQLTPREAFFKPGETAVYDVQVTNSRGEPVQAELSLALVDLAVLTLKDDNAPHILDAFYERQPYRSRVGSGLFISGEGLEVEIPVEVLGRGGGGGGDVAQETALSRVAADEEEEDVRRDFPDTAYWRATVVTDVNGRSTIEIPLPDSLTTWRLSSKAVSFGGGDTFVGQSEADVVVTLPLLLRPVTPRFFTVGDTLYLGAIVNNNLDRAVEATVGLESDGLTINDPGEQSVNVPTGGQRLVQWRVLVNDVEQVDLTFRVDGGGYRDVTKPTFGLGPDNLIPVYRFDARDFTGASGVLPDAGRKVEAVLIPPDANTRRGEIEVSLSPSLAAALTQALDYLNSQEYMPVCAHAISDRLMANVATVRAITTLGLLEEAMLSELASVIPEQIGQLQDLVKADGGWGWCHSDEGNAWITAYALLALDMAAEAGYPTDSSLLGAAADFLHSQLQEPAELAESYQVNRQAFLLYVLANNGDRISFDLDALFDQHRALLEPYGQSLMALAYQQSGEQGNRQQALLGELNGGVILSASGAHWQDEQQDPRNLNSDIRGTAIVIYALAQIDPGNRLLPQAVRWLMTARQAQHWATGHDTAWAILTLTEWLASTGELGADYEYSLRVNLNPVLEGSFTADNITESQSVSLSISDLAPDGISFLEMERGLGVGRLYYTIHLNSYLSAATADAVNRGISVQRFYYDAACEPGVDACQPIDAIESGQQVRVELTIVAQDDLHYAIIEDPIPSGAEAIDPGLDTSVAGLGEELIRDSGEYRYGYWGWWYFNRIEYRDEKVMFTSEFLPAGTYLYTYYLQTNIAGEYQVMPTTARQEFFPDVFGRSNGALFTIMP